MERPLFLAVGYEGMDRRIAELLVDRVRTSTLATRTGGRRCTLLRPAGTKAHVALLLERGAEVNTRDDVGRPRCTTPLIACRSGR